VPASTRRAGPRIGVLTFHRCINYGSYWQARALVEGLRARGHDAVLLDHDCPKVKWAEYRCAFQPLLPERSARRDFPLYAAKARKLLSAADGLPSSRRFPLDRPDLLGEYHTIIVGSDEVWNMRHPWYGGQPIFYGEGLRAQRLVSYAASFGNHDAQDGLHPDWAERLKRFSAISVRDANSRTMLQGAIAADAALVLDPCLQFAEAILRDNNAEREASEPYIAVYGHNFPRWYTEAVRAFAARAGLPLVSIGYRNDWADEQRIDAGPLDFARLIAGAAAVATNFFHGCVFALLNGRPFACATQPYRSNKVRDLMNAVGERERLTEDLDGDVGALLSRPVSQAVTRRIADLRARSEQFLSHALA
jgi:hypothetical protein